MKTLDRPLELLRAVARAQTYRATSRAVEDALHALSEYDLRGKAEDLRMRLKVAHDRDLEDAFRWNTKELSGFREERLKVAALSLLKELQG